MAIPNYALTTEEVNTLRMLDSVPIFAGIGIHEQHLVATRCHMIHFGPNEIIIEQGDPLNDFYIIIKGSVVVTKKNLSNMWIRLNSLGPGDFFGEIALLRNVRRTARVTTQTPCTLLTLAGPDFMEIYKGFTPNSRDNIQLIVAKRLAQQSSMR